MLTYLPIFFWPENPNHFFFNFWPNINKRIALLTFQCFVMLSVRLVLAVPLQAALLPGHVADTATPVTFSWEKIFKITINLFWNTIDWYMYIQTIQSNLSEETFCHYSPMKDSFYFFFNINYLSYQRHSTIISATKSQEISGSLWKGWLY